MSNIVAGSSVALVIAAILAAPIGSPARQRDKQQGIPLMRGFNGALTSIAIADAATGSELAGHQPDLKLNPASCMKIVTSAAALAALGAGHRFRTEFLAEASAAQGEVGALHVRGDGDPMLVNEELAVIAQRLLAKGIRRIAGGIVIDNSRFDSYEFPRKGGNESRAYTAKTSATAVNFNSVAVRISPGAKAGRPADVAINPPTDYFRVVNKVTTGGRPWIAIALSEGDGREVITVTGRIPLRSGEQEFYRSVADPARYAGTTIRGALEQAGILVAGPVREGKAPTHASLLIAHESPPISELVRQMNKRSNNFMAEQILKHLGAARFGAPGSTAKGVAAIEGYLTSIGIPKGSYAIENGSGLSEATRLSARLLVNVLVAAYGDRKIREPFLDSLSVLGMDGTTKSWGFARELTGKVLVKTGTINGVSSLAGYAPTASGRLAAFAIVANSIPRGAGAAKLAELEVVRAITEERR